MTDELQCPDCGGRVRYDLTCHTYSITRDGVKRWMACMPCDSAIDYFCAGKMDDEWGDPIDACGWSYTHGLNKLNPRTVENEKHRPAWLADFEPMNSMGAQALPGIRSAWDT